MKRETIRRSLMVPLLCFGALLAAPACHLTPPGTPPKAEPETETGMDRERIISHPGPAEQQLGGGAWIISAIGGRAVSGGAPPVITFGEDGSVSGFGGCNRFSGGYTQDGAKVSFTPVLMTMMACAAASTNQLESALGAALQGDASYAMDNDGVLTLTGANGTQIRARRAETVKALASSSWRVTVMGGAATVAGREPEIRFTADGQINGTTGCNRFFGNYVQDGAKVTFSGAGSTKMACMEDGLMAQEAAFLAILRGEADVSFKQVYPGAPGQLVLKGPEGTGFTGAPILPEAGGGAPGPDPALLTGAEWGVEEINAGGVIGNSLLTLAFGEDGRVSGSTGCNRISGRYDANDGAITFTPLATTRRACLGEGLMTQERRYMSALGGEMYWTITGDGTLELTGDEGRRVLLRR